MQFVNGYKLIYSKGTKVYASKQNSEPDTMLGTITKDIIRIYQKGNALFVDKFEDGQIKTSKITQLEQILVFKDADDSGAEDHPDDVHGSGDSQHETHTVTVKYSGIEHAETTFTVNVGETQNLDSDLPGLATAEGYTLSKFTNLKGKTITSVTPLDDNTTIVAVFKQTAYKVTVNYQGITHEATTFMVNVGETKELNSSLPGLATQEGFELEKFTNTEGETITSVTPTDDSTVITAVFIASGVGA